MVKVAIITLNYNGKEDTLEFLKSLQTLRTTSFEIRTIVVDNASGDKSVSAIREQFPEVDVLQTGENLGFSGGFNKGLDYASIWGADYFLLINNDTFIKDPDLISELIKTAESDSKIGLVSPKIYFAKGFEFHKDRYKDSDLGKVIWFAGGRFDWDNIASVHRGIDEVDQGQYDRTEEMEIFSGACVLIKRKVIEKIGLLDEKYFLYFEDSDFAKRARLSGFRIYYNGKVAIYHKVSRSTGIGSLVTDYYHTRNRLIFGMKYGRLRLKFALLREALKLFLFGREAQRRGVLDYYLGITGGQSLRDRGDIEYPIKLSIGIVNYNTPDLTRKLIKSILSGKSGFRSDQMEIIVLDNGLIAPCKEEIREFLPKVKYLANSENEGFSRGYNKTIRYSLGRYYLMLNSDIEVLPNSLTELLKAAEDLKEKAVLGGKLVFPDGSDQDSAFHLPTVSGAFKEYFLKEKGSYFMYQPSGEECVRVEGLVMACLLIPKKILNETGLLDEGTFIFFEDIEYARRLKKLNIPIFFVPSARFIHFHGGSTKRIGQEKANERLVVAAKHYHGEFYYTMISFVLRLGQKFGRVETPTTKWES